MDYVNEYLKVSPFIAKQTKENEIAYERLMDVRLKLVDLSFEIDKNHDAYMRFMQQALNSPDLKMRIGKVGQMGEVSKGERIKGTVSVILCDLQSMQRWEFQIYNGAHKSFVWAENFRMVRYRD